MLVECTRTLLVPWMVMPFDTERSITAPVISPPAWWRWWKWWQYLPSSTRPQLVMRCHFITTSPEPLARVAMPCPPLTSSLALRQCMGPVMCMLLSMCMTSALSTTTSPSVLANVLCGLLPMWGTSVGAVSVIKQSWRPAHSCGEMSAIMCSLVSRGVPPPGMRWRLYAITMRSPASQPSHSST